MSGLVGIWSACRHRPTIESTSIPRSGQRRHASIGPMSMPLTPIGISRSGRWRHASIGPMTACLYRGDEYATHYHHHADILVTCRHASWVNYHVYYKLCITMIPFTKIAFIIPLITISASPLPPSLSPPFPSLFHLLRNLNFHYLHLLLQHYLHYHVYFKICFTTTIIPFATITLIITIITQSASPLPQSQSLPSSLNSLPFSPQGSIPLLLICNRLE